MQAQIHQQNLMDLHQHKDMYLDHPIAQWDLIQDTARYWGHRFDSSPRRAE